MAPIAIFFMGALFGPIVVGTYGNGSQRPAVPNYF
jgi:hypothetical protein